MKKGTVLSASDLAFKRPATGIAPARLPDLIGKSLTSDLPADHLLTEKDINW